MNKESKKREELLSAWPKRRLRVLLNAASYTVGNVIIFGGIGYLLDKKFDTAPVLLIIGVVISYPLTQYLLYRKVRKI